jgi:hypothetical protein
MRSPSLPMFWAGFWQVRTKVEACERGKMLGMSALLEYPQRHAISAEEYLRMGESAVFAPEARLELIEGEIVEMAPIGSPHAGTGMME